MVGRSFVTVLNVERTTHLSVRSTGARQQDLLVVPSLQRPILHHFGKYYGTTHSRPHYLFTSSTDRSGYTVPHYLLEERRPGERLNFQIIHSFREQVLSQAQLKRDTDLVNDSSMLVMTGAAWGSYSWTMQAFPNLQKPRIPSSNDLSVQNRHKRFLV